MLPAAPLPLNHSWPLYEAEGRLRSPWIGSADPAIVAPEGTGFWQCDLSDNSLRWTVGVFDLFGLPREVKPSRAISCALYDHDSREAMERLRAYAIKHRRGFTMDAEIMPLSSERRWMRLLAAPVLVGWNVVGLTGVKQDVTHEYKRKGGGARPLAPPTILWNVPISERDQAEQPR